MQSSELRKLYLPSSEYFGKYFECILKVSAAPQLTRWCRGGLIVVLGFRIPPQTAQRIVKADGTARAAFSRCHCRDNWRRPGLWVRFAC